MSKSKESKSKEIRGNRLLNTVRNFLPQIGNARLEGERKVTCNYRGFPFVISSRLIVKEQGLGSRKFSGAITTVDSDFLQKHLRKGVQA